MSSPLALLKSFVLILAAVFLPAALLVTTCAVTWTGMLIGLAGLFISVGPLLWSIGTERKTALLVRSGLLILILGIAILIFIVSRLPNGQTPETSRFHARFADGGWHHQRYGPAGLLPEIDQIHLGFSAALLLDSLFNRAQHRELVDMTNHIYADMKVDPDFEFSASGLSSIYQEMASFDFRDGHYFHYIPPNLDRSKPSQTLVFLHGSGGNFKAYIWLLSKMADRVGCTVIAPTFGLGNWEQDGAYEAITAAIRDANRHVVIDPEQIHLMGLSNGGKGVCLAESQPGPSFRSIILLSAVLHNEIRPATLAARLTNRPALVISGGRDDRVPWDYVDGYASQLERSGMQVTKRRFEDDDHFLFFRRSDAVLSEVGDWLRSHR